MNMKFNALCLATLGGLASLVVPAMAQAANIGYYQFSSCGANYGNPASAITAAGHTPIALATLDSASLAPLGGLVLQTCAVAYPGSAAVDAAVANGLHVMLDTTQVPTASLLPGSPALSLFSDFPGDVSLVLNAPIALGPGGTLTDDSLDTGMPGGGSGITSVLGTADVTSIPAGGYPLIVSAYDSNRAAAFYYPTGNGLVVVSISQWGFVLPGTSYSNDYLAPGAYTYYINTIAWMMGAVTEPVTTCASEGYTGTKLTWCKNICENNLSDAVLETWIHRWINRYRDLPYCAMEGEGQPD